MLTINHLLSGGLMTCYYCSSKCKHCLYNSSPSWSKDYIEKEIVENIFIKIKELGCHSIHIGGGEPFLKVEKLIEVLKVALRLNINIEYIETNSSWFKEQSNCMKILKDIKKLGVNTLLLSMSPFHNEYIPFFKVKGLMKACRQSEIHVFPWIQDFYSEIDAFSNDKKRNSLIDYRQKYGKNYIRKLPRRYGLTMRGRALNTYKEILPLKDLEKILNSSGPCRELANSTHFHIDNYANYIPGLCTGLAICLKDLNRPLSPKDYPFINTLYQQGIKELLNLVVKEYDFQPKSQYYSKCDLCYAIREYLVKEKKVKSKELEPVEYYYQL